MVNGAVLQSAIASECNGSDYVCPGHDKLILAEMLDAVNRALGTDIRYIAQIDLYSLPGAGEIYSKFIWKFTSEAVRAYLIPQMVSDRIRECDKFVLDLYRHFQQSAEYIAAPGHSAPAHIYVRYDNAFRRLKPRRLADDLVQLARNPRDAVYLPQTMRMLASWKLPEIRACLMAYLHPEQIAARDMQITEDKCYYPSMAFIRRELLFCALQGLKYFPSEETKTAVAQFIAHPDRDICFVAKQTYQRI